MKQNLLLLLLAAALFTSCKKSSTNPTTPKTPSNTVIKITDSVKIGNLTWTTVNYNGTGGVNYNNSTTDNSTWGKLYTVAEATAIKLPKGWRLPTTADFNNLLHTMDITSNAKDAQGNYLGGKDQVTKLTSQTLWIVNGTNSSGFNAIPAGFDGDNYNNFSEATGYSSKYVTAAFITSSMFTDATNNHAGHADFFIYQNNSSSPISIVAVITSIDSNGTLGTGRASIRFVRDN